jgi:L-amino acid N-acyltransferase YncA
VGREEVTFQIRCCQYDIIHNTAVSCPGRLGSLAWVPMAELSAINIRSATAQDVPAITNIYNYYVLNSVSTFELDVQPESAMMANYFAVIKKGFPFIVATYRSTNHLADDTNNLHRPNHGGGTRTESRQARDHDDIVVGYAYASPYRPRDGYRFSVENSIYIHPEYHRRGIGRTLLESLIASCEVHTPAESGPTIPGPRQMIAVIGDSANVSSIGLHKQLGFRDVGILTDVGFKFGRWIDVVLLQRPLGDGGQTLPDT